MKLTRPPFKLGTHYRKLTAAERNGRPWKYELLETITVRLQKQFCFGTYYMLDGDGTCWGTIFPNVIQVGKGYQWNGSSCSPDLKGVLLPSVVHDLLYQFSGVPTFPLSRSFADSLFYALSTSPLAFLYRAGLFAGGWACWEQREAGLHIISP